ncbi:MAG: alanine racemase, partial [Burkholderiaceae bacterium]|nr:alanine racemase [Burkholderiaceae bacterium]
GIEAQVAAFERVCADLPGERSLSNSAAILRHSERLRSDWVRAGIMTYGGVPDFPVHDQGFWDLQPAMSLRSKIIAVQHLQPGDTVGYGSSFTATAPMRIGVVACGYADGYPRHCPTGTPVLVDGQRCSTVGRVSMDMLAVDLTALPKAGAGSEVTLWGRSSKGQVLPIDEVAQAAKTIGYELMCALALRVPVTVDHGAAGLAG